MTRHYVRYYPALVAVLAGHLLHFWWWGLYVPGTVYHSVVSSDPADAWVAWTAFGVGVASVILMWLEGIRRPCDSTRGWMRLITLGLLFLADLTVLYMCRNSASLPVSLAVDAVLCLWLSLQICLVENKKTGSSDGTKKLD